MKNVLHQIESKYQEFTKTEKKIADFIIKCPHLIIKMSVQDLAKEINTSTASIVRFSRKITNQGFQELKIHISRYLPSDTTKNNYMEIIDNEAVDTLKSKMLTRATDTMTYTAQQIDNDTIDEVCDVLKKSRTIFLFGYGASSIIVNDLFQKLSRIGLNVRMMEEAHLFMTTLATHDANDCIILVTNQGYHSELQSMVKVANDYKIPIVTITSTRSNPIAKMSNHTIVYGSTDENELRMAATTSLFAQLFTVDILYYRYISLHYHESLDSITQSKMALDNYHKHLSNIKFKH